jgi:Flp pilus assembly protein TadB
MTAEARTSGFVLAGMPLGVIMLIIIASPDYLAPLLYTSPGNAVILLCFCMYGFGIYMMKLSSQVQV